jgi:uncharacterized protein
MKYLLIFGLTIAVIWLWQGKRRSALMEKTRQKKSKTQGHPRQLPTTEIVACDVCSVHLPRTEALTNGRGIYCSEAHRRQAEG